MLLANGPDDPTLNLLSRGVASAVDLQRELSVSQPTMSRTIRQLGDRVVRIGAGRNARYGLRRELPRVGSSWPIFIIDEKGAPGLRGELTALAREQYWFESLGERDHLLSDGLPFFLQDLWPQGFVGRTIPKRYPELELPERLGDWNESHTLAYLTQRGEDCVGNLLLGDESLQRYLRTLRAAQPGIPRAARNKHYNQLAEAAIAGTPAGSSAPGEHPKFTVAVQRGLDIAHVLIKFSPPVTNPVTQRWADLLVAEHLAGKALRDIEVPAAVTEIVAGGERLFLESRRFDRRGAHGRVGIVSLAAVVDHHLGRRDNWMAAAASLKSQRVIPPSAAEGIRRAATLGQLIGNTDMHFGNLSFYFSPRSNLTLAPLYDMLPMLYAPLSDGTLREQEFEPPLPVAGNLDIWPAIAGRAAAYWDEVAHHERISPEFAAIAARNAASVAQARSRIP